jgi:hypothetical protein
MMMMLGMFLRRRHRHFLGVEIRGEEREQEQR